MNEGFTNQYLTAGEIAGHLNISLSKAYELTRQDDFPVCRFGGLVRIPRDAFLSWVAQKTRNVYKQEDSP